MNLQHLLQLLCGSKSLQQLWSFGKTIPKMCIIHSVMASDTVACSHRRKVSCSCKDACLASAELLVSPYRWIITLCSSNFSLLFSLLICIDSPQSFWSLGTINDVSPNPAPLLSSQTSLYSKLTNILCQQSSHQSSWFFARCFFFCLVVVFLKAEFVICLSRLEVSASLCALAVSGRKVFDCDTSW